MIYNIFCFDKPLYFAWLEKCWPNGVKIVYVIYWNREHKIEKMKCAKVNRDGNYTENYYHQRLKSYFMMCVCVCKLFTSQRKWRRMNYLPGRFLCSSYYCFYMCVCRSYYIAFLQSSLHILLFSFHFIHILFSIFYFFRIFSPYFDCHAFTRFFSFPFVLFVCPPWETNSSLCYCSKKKNENIFASNKIPWRFTGDSRSWCRC